MANGSLEKLDTEQLEEVVRQRREFVSKIVSFVEDFLGKHGRLALREVSRWRTNEVRELDQFEGFSFRWETGKTIFGGDAIKIWYHNPERGNVEPELVFDVYCQTHQNVRVFAEGEWQSKLNYLMEHQEWAVERAQEEEQLEQERIEFERVEELRVKDLQEEATRLKL